MTIQQQVKAHIATQAEPKRTDLQNLHERILKLSPGCKLWFDSGKNEEGKVVTNPTIGYGSQVITYANGDTKEYFVIGLSATTTGISVYVLGIKDKTYLNQTFGKELGKAKVTGYCIKFKAVKEIDVDVLEKAILFGFENSKGR